MKTETKMVEFVTYEVGDLLDVSLVKAKTNKPALDKAMTGLIISVMEKENCIIYKMVTNKAVVVLAKSSELHGKAKYLKSIELDFFDESTEGEKIQEEEETKQSETDIKLLKLMGSTLYQ